MICLMFEEEGISSCGKSWIELQVLTWKNLETVAFKNLINLHKDLMFFFLGQEICKSFFILNIEDFMKFLFVLGRLYYKLFNIFFFIVYYLAKRKELVFLF